jgi:glycosyltransferase involved in cell wall biosynthesis
VIAVSSEVADSIRRHAGDGTPIKVIPNGIDPARFRRDHTEALRIRRELQIPADGLVVGTVAVFGAPKRLEDWLLAARVLLNHHPELHFVLVGDGPLRESLQQRSESLELDGVVHFVGLQEDVRPYLASMDVFMMSSMFEGLPLALLEAMAMNCPVVATGVGGIPGVIRHGINGYLVEPCHPEALARMTSELLASEETRQSMGPAGRKTIEKEFSLQRMTQQLEATYTDVLEKGRFGKYHLY